MTDVELVVFADTFEDEGNVTVFCPDDKRVLSGGAMVSNPAIALYASRPLDDLDGWQASAAGTGEFQLSAYAICATLDLEPDTEAEAELDVDVEEEAEVEGAAGTPTPSPTPQS